MRIAFIILSALLVLTACNATQRGAAVGSGLGATAGAIATGTPGGAAVGAAAGGQAGAQIGRASEDGMCQYRRNNGSIYTAPC